MFDSSLVQKADRERREQWEKRRAQTLQRVTAALRSYFEATPVRAVYVTGSLVRPQAYRPGSDIDVAVEGLPPERYFSTLAELHEVLGTEHVDLIELERCSFRRAIEERGTQIL